MNKPILEAKPLIEIAKELLELEEKATPAPWQTRFIARLFKTARDSQYLSFNTHESRDWDDSECISHSRNHIRAVCEALVEAPARGSAWILGNLFFK